MTLLREVSANSESWVSKCNMITAYQCNVEDMQVMYLKYKEQQESSKNQHLWIFQLSSDFKYKHQFSNTRSIDFNEFVQAQRLAPHNSHLVGSSILQWLSMTFTWHKVTIPWPGSMGWATKRKPTPTPQKSKVDTQQLPCLKGGYLLPNPSFWVSMLDFRWVIPFYIILPTSWFLRDFNSGSPEFS